MNYILGKKRELGIFIILIIGLLFLLPIDFSEAQEKVIDSKKKAVILVIDAVSWQDISVNDLPNFKKLINESYIGLMNTKTRGMNRVNAESGYFTLGVGMRSNAPDGSGKNVVSQNGTIKVNRIAELRSKLQQDLPNYTAGKMGDTAKKLGLKVAVVGNADTKVKHREIALAAMDENGVVPYGKVDRELLIKDKDFPGGYRIDEEKLLQAVQKYLPEVDILFIDFGDTARINYEYDSVSNVFQERAKALARADSFLGQLTKVMDEQNTFFMVLVPNASKNSISRGNTSLTPVIIKSNDNYSGQLISNTTRREGLIANIDFAPTIFNYLTGEKKDFIGEPAEYLVTDNNLAKIERTESKFFKLRWGRFIGHGFFVIMLVLSLAFLYLRPFKKIISISEDAKLRLITITLIYPLISFIIAPLLPFRHFIIESVIILLIAIVTGLFLVNWLQKFNHILMAITLPLSLVLLSYLFFFPSFLLNSPFGFDEVFLGGRYYGINNDAMGIMLGATIVGLFSLRQWAKIPRGLKNILFAAYLVVVVFSFTPMFGANVGGTIAAMSLTVLFLLNAYDNGSLNIKKLIIVVGFVFLVEVVIAYLESLFAAQGTHAGRAILALMENDSIQKFLELLAAKLRLFGLMVIIPPYNIILGAEILIFVRLLRKSDEAVKQFREKFPEMYSCMNILFYGGIIAFLFNDTGVIATAIMYGYILLPFGILNKN